MSQTRAREVRETTLVLAENDVLIKHRRAYRNLASSYIAGEKFTSQLPVINAQAKDKLGNLETSIRKEGKSSIIEYNYRKPVKPRDVCAAELSLLIADEFIQRIGDLRILEWGKEDLSDIHFLHTAPFFVSAMGEVHKDKNTIHITPLSRFKSIISHARKGQTIRIEYSPKTRPIPTIVWKDVYRLVNIDEEDALDLELKFLVPRNDKKQKVKVLTNETISLEQDLDGNVWATLSIPEFKGNSHKDIMFTYIISKTPCEFTTDYGSVNFLKGLTEPDSLGHHFLTETPLWPISNKKIQKIAKSILERQTHVFDIVKLIFEFVNQSFTYEINEIRQPADEILNTRKGDCSEFSDLFVTIARACGIPARICTGYIWHKNTKLEGHAWCEVFTKQGWIPVDPLWGFLHGVGFQHLLFSKEGKDVDYPAFVLKARGGNIKITREYTVSTK